MTKRSNPVRPLWEDRFAAPAVDDLLAALQPEFVGLTETLREAIALDPDLIESVRWCGLPWRWALSYRLAQNTNEQDAVAFVVPNPEAPAAVFRLTHEQFRDLPVKKLSRYIRDGLAQTRLVAGVCWPEWAFQSPAHVKDLSDLFGLLREGSLTGA